MSVCVCVGVGGGVGGFSLGATFLKYEGVSVQMKGHRKLNG